MAKYSYAFDSSGNLISAESLSGSELSDDFYCVSCEKPMIARVNGKVQTPHFGHKAKVECSVETYLHRTAKEVFASTYRECLLNGSPFTVNFTAPKVCDRYRNLTGKTCDVERDHHKRDLTDYFSEVRVEKSDGEFVPDVSLHSSTHPDAVVYIEIAVSHLLSEEKKRSGKRIIEIPIKSEDDIERIRSACITENNASFRGFNPKISMATDSECKCVRDNYFAFYVYRSGKCFLENGSLEFLRNKIEQLDGKLAWKNLILDHENKEDSNGYYHPQTPDKVFFENVKLAQEAGISFRNCILCKHHESRFNKTIGQGTFCSLLNISCKSSQAINCTSYSIKRPR